MKRRSTLLIAGARRGRLVGAAAIALVLLAPLAAAPPGRAAAPAATLPQPEPVGRADEEDEVGPERAAAVADPASVPMPPEIEAMVRELEAQAGAIRREGIALLETFLRDSGRQDETAEVLFKLAELIWEEAQAQYLQRMAAYQAAVDACHETRARCREVPKRRPVLDLSRAQAVYERLVSEYPKFRKIDTVIYLYAFSLREQGKSVEAVRYFYKLLRDFPRSRFRADAWMALAEYRFYEKNDVRGALKAYDNVVKFPSSQLHGLALFKTAWCFWKLGDTEQAAQRFKAVLDLGEAARSRGAAERKRAAELQDQALEYLVELFIEDETKSARDAFDFMVQIGGKQYSQRVLRKLADTVYDQTRFERAAEAYLFLLALDPGGKDAPDFQIRIIESFQALEQHDRAAAEMRKLATNYGPGSAWARANRDRPKTVARARERAEEFIRIHAKTLHANAQRNEKESKTIDKDLYAQAADAYGFYLEQFGDTKHAAELRYYRADILYFKLGKYREAGDAYLALGQSKPVGEYHKEALLQSMRAFERLRPPPPKTAAEKKARKITDEDRKFAAAADLYLEAFPEDTQYVDVVFKNGQFFYDYGEYDEAVKRFGLILERYGDSPVAVEAGDQILRSFAEASDYENIEHWARRLKKAKAFAKPAEQKRLDGLIVGAMMKSADAYAEKGEFILAAERYQRAADENPGHEQAPLALYNAGAAYEKAGRPAAAVAAYRKLAKQFPNSDKAPLGLFTAAQLEESVADYGNAALLYEEIVRDFPRWERGSVALKNAGLLRQSLGDHDQAAAHYASYEKKYRDAADARDVAFSRALLVAGKKDFKQAATLFSQFAKNYPNDPRVIEALVNEARAHLAAGAESRANEAAGEALQLFRRAGAKAGKDAALYAAEARYLQGEIKFREYEAVKIAGGAKQLQRLLERKATLLDDARKIYLDVLSFKVPEWATAALYQIGRGYALYAESLRSAEVPRGLTPEEQTLYREELEKHVIVIEEKALDAYRMGYAKAIEIGVYNAYTKRLRDALAELDPSSFPPAPESRIGPRVGEPVGSVGLLEEIRRD